MYGVKKEKQPDAEAMRINGSLCVINTGLEYALSTPVSALRYSGTDLPPPLSDHKASKGTRGHLGLPHTSLFSTEIHFSQSEYSITFSCLFPHPSLVRPLPVLQGLLTAFWSWLSTSEWNPWRMADRVITPSLQPAGVSAPNASFHSEEPQGIGGEDPPTSLTPQHAVRNVSLGWFLSTLTYNKWNISILIANGLRVL